MKEIPLTQGRVALVDDEDFDRLSRHKWYAYRQPGTETYYATRTRPRSEGKKGLVYMHREILGATRGQVIHHMNGDGTDNRRANIRFCTVRENNQGSRKKYKGTSRYRGVHWSSRREKWAAEIRGGAVRPDGRRQRVNLGDYASEQDAAIAYDRAAVRLFGEFASTNFPTEQYREPAAV